MKVTKLKRVVLKEEFMAITKNLESALILAQMCYWSEKVYDIDKFLEEECMAYAEENKLKHHGWIRKSAKQLSVDMYWAFSGRTILRHFNDLVKAGFLDRRRNPDAKYKFDHSFQYRVNFCAIQKALKAHGYRLSGYIITDCFDGADEEKKAIRQNDASIGQNGESVGLSVQSNGQDGETITETILEINNRETPIVPLEGDKELFPSDSISTNSATDSSLGRSSMDSRPSASTDYMARFKTKANRLMNRRDSTPWSKKEMISARPHLNTCDEDWAVLEKYYACRGQDGFFHRTSMLTLLNNFAGEIDKAKSKFPPAPQIPDEKTDPVAAGLYWKNLVNRD
jgi:hypothetical protein